MARTRSLGCDRANSKFTTLTSLRQNIAINTSAIFICHRHHAAAAASQVVVVIVGFTIIMCGGGGGAMPISVVLSPPVCFVHSDG